MQKAQRGGPLSSCQTNKQKALGWLAWNGTINPCPCTDKPRAGLAFKTPPPSCLCLQLPSCSEDWCGAASCPLDPPRLTLLCPAHHPGKWLCPDLWHSLSQYLLFEIYPFLSFLTSHKNCNSLHVIFNPGVVAFSVMNYQSLSWARFLARTSQAKQARLAAF